MDRLYRPLRHLRADTHTVEYFSAGADGSAEAIKVMDFDKGTFVGHGSF